MMNNQLRSFLSRINRQNRDEPLTDGEGTVNDDTTTNVGDTAPSDSNVTDSNSSDTVPGDKTDAGGEIYSTTVVPDYGELMLYLDGRYDSIEAHLQFYDLLAALLFVLIVAKSLWWLFYKFIFGGL